ncbi:MAG: IPT/TIG domain-containing protein [Dehalogenimonas sp.]
MKTKFKALLRALPVMLLATLALTATVAPVSAGLTPTTGGVYTQFAINETVVADTQYSVVFSQFGIDKAIAGVVSSTTTTLNANVTVPQLPRGIYDVILRPSPGTPITTGQFNLTPTVFLSSAEGSVGSPVAVVGRGFAPLTAITIHLDSMSNPILQQATTDINGAFTSQSFNVPATTKGSHIFFAKETSTPSIYAYVSYLVNPGISLSTETGKVGDTITVTGGGFTAGGSVQLYFDTVHADNLLKTITANASTSSTPGAISTTINIPAAARGNHLIIARDVASTTNTPGKTYTVTPKVTVNPNGGAVGSSVTVTGSGFSANTSVSFEWDGSAISGVTAVTTNATGGFTKTFNVPASTSGEHTITARDATGPAEATYTVAAKITLTPDSGTAGSTVSVQGNGFQTTGSVSITYDNVVMTTATLTNGTFTATFTIPGGVAGAHTVRATDGLSNTAVATFTSTLSATLSPITSTAAPGYVGQDLTLTGTGFLPTSAITASFGTSAIGSATSDATGAFTITFKAPAVATGNHTVTVTDGTNTRTFTFVMEGVAPAAPVLATPDGIEKPKQPIVYEWADVTDDSGVTYTLEVFTTPELNVLILKKEGLTTSSYTATEAEKLPSVSKDAPYYWRVTATDGAGNVGTPTEPVAFTVGFSFGDLIPDNVPTWAWITIGVIVVLLAGGLAYYFYRRSYSY